MGIAINLNTAFVVKPLAAPLRAVPKLTGLRASAPRAESPCFDLPRGLDAAALRDFDAAFGSPVKVKKREYLLRAGAAFTTLYAVRLGTFKSLLLAGDGHEQVMGYHMAGDILGLDAIGHDVHVSEAVALEDSEVRALAFSKLDELARRQPRLRHNLLGLLSRAARGNQEMMLVLGSMRSEQRVATYLLNLAERFGRGGYSASELVLRMTRDEIASYLGMQIETVSRLFSRMHQEGVIQVQGRAVKLLDRERLKQLADPGA